MLLTVTLLLWASDPSSHTILINRSLAFFKLGKFQEALTNVLHLHWSRLLAESYSPQLPQFLY